MPQLLKRYYYFPSQPQSSGGGGGGSTIFIPEDYNASITNLPPTTYAGGAPTRGAKWYVTVPDALVGGDRNFPAGSFIEYLGGGVGVLANYKVY